MIISLQGRIPRRKNCRHFQKTRTTFCRKHLKTLHVETVVKMSNQKYKPDSYVKMEVDAEDYYRIKDEG